MNKLGGQEPSELARLKRESQLASRAANEANNRSQLLAVRAELDDVGAPTSSSQRDRMAQATQQLDRTGNRIRDGKRTLLETEDLGSPSARPTCTGSAADRERTRTHTRRGR